MEEILWNDPWKGIHTQDWSYSERGIGRLFGINISPKNGQGYPELKQLSEDMNLAKASKLIMMA
jgi:hypothetical protein